MFSLLTDNFEHGFIVKRHSGTQFCEVKVRTQVETSNFHGGGH